MRQVIFLFTVLFSSFSFAQSTGSIFGLVMDDESYNEPLIYASVAVDGTAIESYTDENGFFQIENLADGNYTLMLSFNGYETKELQVQVTSNQQTNVSATLIARTLSLSDTALLIKVEGQ